MNAGIIFDVDGTLLDSMPVWMDAGSRYLGKQGISPEPDLAGKLLPLTMTETAVYLKNTYRLPSSPEEIMRQINSMIMDSYENSIRLKDGVRDLLSGLAEYHVPFAAATMTDRGAVEAAFRRLGILDLFKGIFTATETGCGKDRPDIYLAAAAATGTAVCDTWVFEDALFAAETAKRAGFKLAAVFDESSRAEWPALSAIADYRVTAASDYRSFLCLLR